MSKQFSTKRFQLSLNLWAEEAASPNAGAGTAAAIGSFWQEGGTPPTIPTTLFLKSRADDKGWLRQNITGLNIFNVKDPTYGATGNGVTDDTTAIRAAFAACDAAGGGIVYFPAVNTAGGQSYLVTKQAVVAPNGYASILLDNAHNITVLGDGYASVISASGDALATIWDVFLIRNGSSHICFQNIRIIGSAMTNTVDDSHLIAVRGNTADANTGITDILVNDCHLGPSKRGLVIFKGDDVSHLVNDVAVRRCALNGASSLSTTVNNADVVINNFVNNADCTDNMFFGSVANQPVTFSPNASVLAAGVTTWDLSSNQFSGTGTASVTRGIAAHNTFLDTSILAAASLVDGKLEYRGNIGMGSVQVPSALTGSASLLVGNVLGAGFILVGATNTNTSLNVAICDNIVERAGAVADNVCIEVASCFAMAASVTGNITNLTTVTAGQGACIRALAIDQSPGIDFGGNLCIASGAAADGVLYGMSATVGAGAPRGRVTKMNNNLVVGCRNGMAFLTGTFLEWRDVCNNNVSPTASGASTIVQPAGNIGVTGEGPAGPGSQIAVSAATMIANVTAPVGSLGCNTTGGAGTAVFRKEAGAGVSGGTADWYGIGGFPIAFGCILGSAATAARFLGTGEGMAVENAVEVQVGMPRPGTMRNMYFRCGTGTGVGGGTNTYTIRKNGVDTTLTLALLNTAAAATDLTHSFTFAKADLISCSVTKSVAPGTPQGRILVTVEIV